MSFDFSGLKSKYDQVIQIVEDDLRGIQTGRAKPALVEEVQVEAYGSRMPLKELASITAPDPHMIVIQPWDKSVVSSIEKALSTGKVQFNPNVDGQIIRINIAQLTGEKREEYVKLVHQRIESGRQMIRAERNDTKKQVDGQDGQPGISEDDIKRDLEELDKITSTYLEKMEAMGEEKEKEIRTI